MTDSRTRKWVGLTLLLVSFAGVLQGLRASVAYSLYFRTRYGVGKGDLSFIQQANTTAWNLYPYNVHACLWAARENFAEGLALSDAAREIRMDTARLWCERGLRLNPRKRELRQLQTRLVKEYDLDQAIAIWEDYTAWDRWEPDNYVFLMSLYAEAGDAVKADRVLAFLESRPIAFKRAKIYSDWIKTRADGQDSGD